MREIYCKVVSGSQLSRENFNRQNHKRTTSNDDGEIFRLLGIIFFAIFSAKIFAHGSKLSDVESIDDTSRRWNGGSDSNDFSSANWSTAEQCLRPCDSTREPLYCYYHFTLEYYTTMNGACTLCRPRNTNQLSNIEQCQCVEADGFERTVLTVNRMIPGPSIQLCRNDMVIIDVENKMEGIGVALHWHGLFQEGYQYYDGVPYVTQCPINSPNTFRYQFRAKNPGTHFWHSHVAVHKIDGQYGSLIVRQPSNEDPFSELYDKDLPTHVVVLSDWMHEISMERYPGLLKRLRGQGPANVLINGKGTWKDPASKQTTNTSIEIFYVDPGFRYRFRLINAFSTVCLAQLSIEDHSVTVIAQDGENVEPEDVDTIITGSGERVDFIVTTNRPANRSYWIQVKAINEQHVESVYQLAVLKYTTSSGSVPPTEPPTWNGLDPGIVYNPSDAQCGSETEGRSICVHEFKSISEIDPDILAVKVDHQFVIPFKFYSYKGHDNLLYEPGSYRRFLTSPDHDLVVSDMNGIAYKEPPEPPIYMSDGNYQKCNNSAKNFGEENEPRVCTHTLDVPKGAVVEIVLFDSNEKPILTHPFHIHGNNFRVFDVGRFPAKGNNTRADMEPILREHKRRLAEGLYRKVPAKDTIIVPLAGWAILRFKAVNPGWWFFHCHFIWHSVIGMNLVIHVGEQSDLPPVPPGFPHCGNFVPAVRPYI